MDKRFDLTPLVDSLSNSFARRLGLNRRGFLHLLQACHFEEGINHNTCTHCGFTLCRTQTGHYHMIGG